MNLPVTCVHVYSQAEILTQYLFHGGGKGKREGGVKNAEVLKRKSGSKINLEISV